MCMACSNMHTPHACMHTRLRALTPACMHSAGRRSGAAWPPTRRSAAAAGARARTSSMHPMHVCTHVHPLTCMARAWHAHTSPSDRPAACPTCTARRAPRCERCAVRGICTGRSVHGPRRRQWDRARSAAALRVDARLHRLLREGGARGVARVLGDLRVEGHHILLRPLEGLHHLHGHAMHVPYT